MRPNLLTRFLLSVVACASVGAVTSDVFAQTQQLNKELVRKFPEGFCPLDTNLIGTFVTDTGIIQLTFVTGLGPHGVDAKSGGIALDITQVLDDISIIEAAEFNDPANQQEDPGNCYFDNDPPIPVFTGDLLNNPAVPFYDALDPSTSPCPWDETNGFTITGGVLQVTGDPASTSVVISGLTPGTAYIIHGRWSANGFPFATACDETSLCLQVTVDDLESGCGSLSTESKTWGAVKALYRN
jgi:hypothetical protein